MEINKFKKSSSRLKQSITEWVYNLLSSIHKNPVFVLGNEKSGTTIIAASLAKATGNSVKLDIPGLWDPVQTKLYNGELTIRDVIKKNKYAFSKKIIKEPVLTFEYDSLKQVYPESSFVLIIRDPRDNIRSILNRLKIDGNMDQLNQKDIDSIGELWQTWNTVIDAKWLGIKEEHYIASMAARWNFIVDLYLQNEDKINLIRYEDFIYDKVKTIENLAQNLGMTIEFEINEFVDIQFQPKGNSEVSYLDFFGVENLNKINTLCAERMKKLDYEV